MLKRIFVTLCMVIALSLSAVAQTQDSSSIRDKMKALAEKYDEVNGIESLVCVKGSGLEMMKLMFRKEMGKDFIKGVDMIIFINYADAPNDLAKTIRGEVEGMAKDLREEELPKDMTDGKYMRNFFSLSNDEKEIHDMIILVEEGDSKSVVYFGGVMKDDSDK